VDTFLFLICILSVELYQIFYLTFKLYRGCDYLLYFFMA